MDRRLQSSVQTYELSRTCSFSNIVPTQDQYILDAGLDAGLELPYTCRGGICGCVGCQIVVVTRMLLHLRACVGKVTQGSVDQSDVRIVLVVSACNPTITRRWRTCHSAWTRARSTTCVCSELVCMHHHHTQGMALLCMARPVGDCTIETQSDYGYSLGIAEWKGATGKITGGKVQPLMGKKWEEIKQ